MEKYFRGVLKYPDEFTVDEKTLDDLIFVLSRSVGLLSYYRELVDKHPYVYLHFPHKGIKEAEESLSIVHKRLREIRFEHLKGEEINGQ